MNIEREQVFVWSRKIRFFHWLNVITILLLMVIGVIILNSKLLGVSNDGKVLLKTIHVLIGYVFGFNLVWRLLFAFVGKGYEKWREMLPFKQGFTAQLRHFKQGKLGVCKGHNPIGKLMVLALLSLMSLQLISGLVLAGTDIYYPPFGRYVVQHIAVDQEQLNLIQPYSKVNVEQAAYQQMRSIRKPFITVHIYAFYALLCCIALHIIGVIIAERKERSGLVSAMITGYKYTPKETTDDG